ncbi:MAG: ABC transporter permease [Thermoanaerobaculia bacterium]|nr:ABC transporter permease [Thermoanaerobaculia bacterium]
MELRNVLVLKGKELRDAWRNRWFVLYAVTFVGLALAMAWVSVAGIMGSGFAGLGRTAASLVNLVVLIVPLMGLTLGAGAIAGDRERGLLLYTLAQPVTLGEIVVAKFWGLASALLAALLVGFGAATLIIAGPGAGGEIGAFVAFLGFSMLIALAMASVGLLISSLSASAATASGVALFVWLLLVLLGDLGLMGTALVLELDASTLLLAALLNPLQVFKLAAVVAIRGGAEVLGPAGLYASRELGGALLPLLGAILLLWVIVPLVASWWLTRRRGVLA